MQENISTIIEILREYNEVMNSTLGDTIKVTSSNGATVRKATLQDTIDLYESEWAKVVERLIDETGIDLEDKEGIATKREDIKTNIDNAIITMCKDINQGEITEFTLDEVKVLAELVTARTYI